MRDSLNQIDGWIIIDKPYDIGSTTVVSKLKWSLRPTKIGHAGTLDPLATGVLPIALGRATKLIPYVMDGSKTYEFQITFGSETSTDDVAGAVTAVSDNRPTAEAILSVLPDFIGVVEQLPPAYSALKINGRRAYDLARAGELVDLKPRPVRIDSLEMVRFSPETADFRVVCGKGTYVRSLGRDIGRRLGCLGHISVLRRVACGPFAVHNAVPLSVFDEKKGVADISVLPLDTAADVLPAVVVTPEIGKRLSCGQRVPLRPLSFPDETVVRIMCGDVLIGLAHVIRGVIHPYRMF